jgi:hypothetical protein
MSFSKSLLLALLATLFITYVLGYSMTQWLGVSVYMDGEFIEPLQAISFSALVAMLLVIIAGAIFVSIFGVVLFAVCLVCGSIVLAFLGVFWPVLAVALLLYWLTKPTSSQA